MQTTLLIILIVLFLAALVVLYLMYRRLVDLKKPKEGEENLFVMLQNQINEISRTLDSKLGESTKMFQQQFSQTHQIVKDVTEKLTKLDDTNKQVMGFAGQLQSLEDVLKNPKHRGILGEYYLEAVLKNVLPPSAYQMQYRFDDGDIVDAVVFVKDKIIPIDSKFSLENYNRIVEEKDPDRREELQRQFKQDLKNRIDETSKYIKPNKGTMDFAFMFIPAEGIYYDLLVNKVGAIKLNTHDMIEYAFKEKHVIIVSPTSFFAYLQTVMQGLRALQIEESAKEIRKQVEKLGRHLLSYEEYLKKMGNSLNTTVNMYNSAYKEFGKIDKDVVKVTEGEKSVEPVLIDKPGLD